MNKRILFYYKKSFPGQSRKTYFVYLTEDVPTEDEVKNAELPWTEVTENEFIYGVRFLAKTGVSFREIIHSNTTENDN
jgi:hypothetical protein